jgi:hypothetical protein
MIHDPRTNNFFLTLISRIFDPFLVLATVVIAVVFQSTLASQARIYFLLILVGVMLLPPVLFLYIAIKMKRISDWDVSKREQRPMAMLILFFLGFINIITVQKFGDPGLVHLFIQFQMWLVGFMMITFFWKISGHASVMALATGIIITIFGWSWWPVLFLVPIISVVRVLRKDHTVLQVIMGAIYSWLLIWITG